MNAQRIVSVFLIKRFDKARLLGIYEGFAQMVPRLARRPGFVGLGLNPALNGTLYIYIMFFATFMFNYFV